MRFRSRVDHQLDVSYVFNPFFVPLNVELKFQANEDVTQNVEILPNGADKWTWLIRRLVSFTSGTVVFFSQFERVHLVAIHFSD